jgi:hypothetical protein
MLEKPRPQSNSLTIFMGLSRPTRSLFAQIGGNRRKILTIDFQKLTLFARSQRVGESEKDYMWERALSLDKIDRSHYKY